MNRLKKLFTKWWFYLIVFAVTLGIPFLINEAYKVGKGYVTLWKAEDVLSFYGSYLSFIGTVILGVVAVYQNRKAHQLNEQMQKLQQAQFVSMISAPRLTLAKLNSVEYRDIETNMGKIETVVDLTDDGVTSPKSYHINVEFENSSEYPIVQLIAHPGNRGNAVGILYGMREFTQSAVYIPAHGKSIIRFLVPSLIFDDQKDYRFTLCVDLVNVFEYCTPAKIIINNLEAQGEIRDYTFRLSQFTDVRPKTE